MSFNQLSPEEERVIIQGGTEQPFSGKYNAFSAPGLYLCKRCNAPLYRADDKFESHCGWPSFDAAFDGAVKQIPDPDGRRTEIQCRSCGAHLGHIFTGEDLTPRNRRHCVNSISMQFVSQSATGGIERAVFASGCFWGTEYHLSRVAGVLATTVGYTGGKKTYPTYQEVCRGTTGHAEAVEVVYDSRKVSFETLARLFFETHDPTQVNRQGPDIGHQYRSAIFYMNEAQRSTAVKLVEILQDKGYQVVTEITPAGTFWKAEDYHQDYYANRGELPYCHIYKQKF